MGGVVGRAELGRPPPRQCLALIASSEKGQFLGVCLSNFSEPARCDFKCFCPLDLDEFALPALPDTFQRFS